jgi:transcriptional regulator with XRE-family HTH domain
MDAVEQARRAIREALRARGMNRTALARLLGVKYQAVHSLLRDNTDRGMNLTTLERVAAALDMRVVVGLAPLECAVEGCDEPARAYLWETGPDFDGEHPARGAIFYCERHAPKPPGTSVQLERAGWVCVEVK